MWTKQDQAAADDQDAARVAERAAQAARDASERRARRAENERLDLEWLARTIKEG